MAQLAQRTAAKLNQTDEYELSIAFVDDTEIQRLNRVFRGIDSPTDVLSFANDEDEIVPLPDGAPVMLGDVVISLERAVAQAEEYGHSLDREIGFLLVHGLLHLFGYDHQGDDESMDELTENILQEAGLSR